MLCWCGLGVVSELSPAPATNAACRIRAPRRRLPVGISSTIGALPLASPVKPKPCGRRHSSPSTANRWPTSSPMSGVVTTTAQTRPLGERTSRELTGGALAGSPCGATRSPDPYPVGPPTLRGRRTATRANAAGRRRSERSPPWSCRHRCRSRARTRAQDTRLVVLALRAIAEMRSQTSLVDVQHSAGIRPPCLSICTPSIMICYAFRDEDRHVPGASRTRGEAPSARRRQRPLAQRGGSASCDPLLRIENGPGRDSHEQAAA